MDWKTHRKLLLKDPDVVKALMETELEFQIAKAIIAARIESGLSQKELADKLQTKQSVISRVETAKTTPSLSFLRKLALALNLSVQVHFTPL